jgi:hypothetical protein
LATEKLLGGDAEQSFFVGVWAMVKFLGVLVAALGAWGSAAQADEHGRWQQLENNPSCSVWNLDPKSSETVTWTGACVDGKARGSGTQVWRYLEKGEWKTEKYTGEMKDGKRTGSGMLVWADGGRYEGDWKDDVMHGRGILEWTSGKRYEGEYRDGKQHGRGILVYENGNRYDGGWKDGKEHGRGVLTFANGNELRGEFAGHRFSGRCFEKSSGMWFECYHDGTALKRVK